MNAGAAVSLLAGSIGALAAGLLMNLATREAEGWLFRVPPWLLRLASRRVPAAVRDDLYEEWTAELQIILRDTADRPLTRLVRGTQYALGFLLTSRQIARALGPARSAGPADNVATTVIDIPPLTVRPKPGPTVRRRRLGSELRRLREAHSFKLEEVADRLGLAPSTLSRIETGRAPTKTAYLTTMFDIYGVVDPAHRQTMTDMARDGHRKGWWAVYDDVLPTGYDICVGIEAEASALRVFEDQVVHGLLQTKDYARIVMTAVRMRQTPTQIDRAVELRIQRQEALNRDDPLKLWLILNEAVIRRTVGGAEVMHGQLMHLLEASEWPSVTLQVLPLSSGAHPALNGPFTILEFPERTDPDVVYTEGVAGHAYLERDPEVDTCAEAFDLLQAAALSPADSAALISRLARDITLIRQRASAAGGST
jgi:transcriptional regulator with XRE-family HTH domain